MKKPLILFSGGADSLLMLHLALVEGHHLIGVILYDYGQKNREELSYAENLLHMAEEDYNLLLRRFVINLSPAFAFTKSNLLQDSSAAFPGVHPAHVPSRNAIFLSVAMGIAETDGYDEIWIGCDKSDEENQFPDCTHEWIGLMDSIAQINGSRPLRVKAPLHGLHKEEVLHLLTTAGYNLDNIYSGYERPTERQ